MDLTSSAKVSYALGESYCSDLVHHWKPLDKCVKRVVGIFDSPVGVWEISGGTFQP